MFKTRCGGRGPYLRQVRSHQPSRAREHRPQVQDLILVLRREEACDRVRFPVDDSAPPAVAAGQEEVPPVRHAIHLANA